MAAASFGQHTRHNPTAESAIVAEIAIGGEEDGIGVGLGHADEAGVGKAHWHVRILLHESQDGLLLLTKHKGRQQLTTEEKRRERSGAVPPKEKNVSVRTASHVRQGGANR